MNKIYNIIGAAFASLALLASCDEWEPVFTGNYGEADIYEPVTMTPNTTILELKKMYTEGTPLTIEKDIIIGGQVISEDKSGNIYKSLYIQDATAGIELKLGKNGLYNDYKLGQWVYVKCSGLTLGAYNGMIQLGCEDPTNDYETSYMEAQYLIDTHVFRGEIGTPLTAKKVAETDLTKEENLGCYVELDGLTYGNEIFLLVYIDPNKDTKDNDNRIFFSDKTWGVTTWAMSKQGFINYLESGVFDSGSTNTGRKVTDVKPILIKNASAYSVSQYFKMGSSDVQVRTSGYARFADTQIDPAILSGNAKVNMKGILSIYKGQAQFTLIDLKDGVEIVK
ncbi:MAG: DUF5689 domain-containing protein [Bacteroides sp.]|nr:DUF5689 domain-containing protein [Bacteroides sp.]